jgi:NADPH2:quinone reductase
MKAAWYERNGAARDVLVVGKMPTPEPGPGEVRVRLHVSGANPSDVKSRLRRPPAFPRIIPHSDGAGIVDAVGDGVDRSRIGERVWIWNGQWKRALGTAAEFIVVPEAQAVALDDNTGLDAGACMGIPGLTAVQAVRLAEPCKGKTILVTGAAAAVGHYVTQIATLRGARVLGTASAARADHARAAGAAEIIDYKAEDVAARVKDLTDGRGVDAIVDMDFSSTAKLLPEGVLAPHGKLVCYGSNVAADVPLNFPAMLWGSLTVQMFLVYELTPAHRAAAIADLRALLREGRLKHTIGARFPFGSIAEAHEAVEGGRVIGNVVVDVSGA